MITFHCSTYCGNKQCRDMCENLEVYTCCIYCKKFRTCKQHCNLDDYHLAPGETRAGLTGQMLKLFVMKKQIKVLPPTSTPELDSGTET